MTEEESALTAIINGDRQEATRILEDFFPTELAELSAHLLELNDLVDEVHRTKSARGA